MSPVDSHTPFPGLRPFTRADARYFFGRDRHLKDLRALLERHRFVPVVGRSGDGKSSLVAAGLLPLILSETDEDGTPLWLHGVMQPRGAPLRNLARMIDSMADIDESTVALSPEMRQDRLMARLQRSSHGLQEAIAEMTAGRPRPVLIIVDQFEELFRFDRGSIAPEDHEQAATFVDLLLQATRADAPDVHVLITLRSDFLGECPLYRGLAEAINASQFLVPRLTRIERRRAIEDPVRFAGGTIEEALVQRLLNDAGDAPDMLPVMQHVLMRLWQIAADRRRPPHLMIEDYRTVGGMAKALSNHADDIYNSLEEQDRVYAERIFRALVDIDADGRVTRRTPAPRLSDLAALCDQSTESALRVIDTFRGPEANFLTPLGSQPLAPDDIIDISHEALLRRWSRLAEWVALEEEDARTYRTLLDAARDENSVLPAATARLRLSWWRDRNPTSAWADRYGGCHAEVQGLIRRTRTYLRNERWKRTIPYAFGALAISALGYLAVFAHERHKLHASEARRLATEVVTTREVQGNNPHIVALMREVMTRYATPPAVEATSYNALMNPYMPDEESRKLAAASEALYNWGAFSFLPDQDLLLSSDYSHTTLWEPESGKLIHTFPGRLVGRPVKAKDGRTYVTTMDYSNDATKAKDRAFNIWDIEDKTHVARVNGVKYDPFQVYFDDIEGLIIFVGYSGEVTAIRIANNNPIYSIIGSFSAMVEGGRPQAIKVDADNGIFYAFSYTNERTQIFDLYTGSLLNSFYTDFMSQDSKIVWAPPLKTFLRVEVLDKYLKIRATADNVLKEIRIFDFEGKILDAKILPDNKNMVILSQSGEVFLIDLESGSYNYKFTAKSKIYHYSRISFNNDGSKIIIYNGAIPVYYYDLLNEKYKEKEILNDNLNQLYFNLSSSINANASLLAFFESRMDNILRLWDLEKGEMIATMAPEAGWYRNIDHDEERRCIAVEEYNGTEHEWCKDILFEDPPHLIDEDKAPDWAKSIAGSASSQDGDKDRAGPWFSSATTPVRLKAEQLDTPADTGLVIANAATDQPLAEITVPEAYGPILNVTFDHAGQTVLIETQNLLTHWRLPDPGWWGSTPPLVTAPVATLPLFGQKVAGTALFAPDDSQVAARMTNGQVQVWPVFPTTEALRATLDALDLPPLTTQQECTYQLRSDAQCSNLTK